MVEIYERDSKWAKFKDFVRRMVTTRKGFRIVHNWVELKDTSDEEM